MITFFTNVACIHRRLKNPDPYLLKLYQMHLLYVLNCLVLYYLNSFIFNLIACKNRWIKKLDLYLHNLYQMHLVVCAH